MMATMFRFAAFVILAYQIVAAGSTYAQAKTERRFGVDNESENYPQRTAKEALASVVKAIDGRKYEYLLAQLLDPAYVDRRVQEHDGNFRELVKETAERFNADPTILKELKRFASQAEWEEGEDTATARLKDVKGRAVFLKKIDTRWYMENRQKAEPAPKEKEKDK
jgi:hypothetical protein